MVCMSASSTEYKEYCRFATPVLIATTVVYLAGLLLFMPLELVAQLVGLKQSGTLIWTCNDHWLLMLCAYDVQVGVLSLGTVSSTTMSRHFRTWLSDSVALVPFLSMLLLRQGSPGAQALACSAYPSGSWVRRAVGLPFAGVRKPLYKCFIHLLREINPEAAAAIESGPSQQRERSNSRRGGKGVRMVQKVGAPGHYLE